MYGRTRLRLTLWYAAVFLTVLLILGAGTYFGLVWALDREVDAGIRAVADEWTASAPPIDTLEPLDVEAHEERAPTDVFLVVFRADRALVANPRGAEAEELLDGGLVDAALAGHEAWGTVSSEGARLRVRATPLLRAGEVTGAVIAGRNLAGRDESVRTIVVVLGVVAGSGLLLALGAGYLLAGRALVPLRLAHDRQRKFIGDASHELRAPLTLIRALAELLQRGRLDADQRATTGQLIAVTEEANALVDDLLALARLSETPVEAAQSSVTDLASAAAVARRQLQRLLETHKSDVEEDLEAAPAVLPDREAVRVVRALLDNVIAHTPRGTRVRLSTSADDRHATVSVDDSGPGVDDAELQRIFERFTQLSAARTPGTGTGAGLGLPIVQAIATRHRGQATATRSPLGGLRVEVRLPRARATPETQAGKPQQ